MVERIEKSRRKRVRGDRGEWNRREVQEKEGRKGGGRGRGVGSRIRKDKWVERTSKLGEAEKG